MSNPVPGLAPQVERWTSVLLEQGWCVIPSLTSPDAIRALDRDLASDFNETPFCKGGFYGARTKRFGRLLARSPLAGRIVQHPLVLGISRRVLGPWCDTIQLNLTQALALHPGSAAAASAPRPGYVARCDRRDGISGQRDVALHALHAREWRDHRSGREATAAGARPRTAARRIPGRARARVRAAVPRLDAPRRRRQCQQRSPPRSDRQLLPRLAQALREPVARLSAGGRAHFSPELAALVGYQQHRPNLGNYEGQCPSVLLQDEFPERLAATDALRPDQEALVAEFVRDQDWPERAAVA